MPEERPMKPTVVIITGLSGSGKTVAIRAMEDSGYSCVDNLPPQLVDSFASTMLAQNPQARIAVGIDIRSKEFFRELDTSLPALREKYDLHILFLEADMDTLVRRFKETRRPHPLMDGTVHDVSEAIAKEKGLLLPLRDGAERIIETSPLNPHQLRQLVISAFGGGEGDAMGITLMSFGFKNGTPQTADLVFDVRFLPNPHYVPELKELTGLDAPVRQYVMVKDDTMAFVERLKGMLEFLIPRYRKEGKANLTIGIGCTGGRHRSIAVTEEMAFLLRKDTFDVNVIHRDI
jgi:UPF0042 nucleotide-binding protein